MRSAALAFGAVLFLGSSAARADGPAEIVVDGTSHVPIPDDGRARVTVGPGEHTLELVPAEKAFPTRKVVGGSLVALGVVALIVSAGFAHEYLANQDDEKTPALRALYPPTQTPDSLCAGATHAATLNEVCRLNDESKKHSTLAVVTGASGVLLASAGLVLLFVRDTEKPHVVPLAAPNGAGFAAIGAF